MLGESKHPYSTPTGNHLRSPFPDARNTGNKIYLRKWVAEVTVATANGALIRRYMALTNKFQRIRGARATVKKYSAGE